MYVCVSTALAKQGCSLKSMCFSINRVTLTEIAGDKSQKPNIARSEVHQVKMRTTRINRSVYAATNSG